MGQEYVPAIDMWVPDANVFTDALTSANPADISIVIHKTACNSPCSAQDVANDFQSSSPGPSTHFIVGLDGTVVQCVHLKTARAVTVAWNKGMIPTGIVTALAGKMSACMPLSSEISTVDWNGHAIIFQPFSNGCHAEFAAGSATIYDGFNHAVYHGSLA